MSHRPQATNMAQRDLRTPCPDLLENKRAMPLVLRDNGLMAELPCDSPYSTLPPLLHYTS